VSRCFLENREQTRDQFLRAGVVRKAQCALVGVVEAATNRKTGRNEVLRWVSGYELEAGVLRTTKELAIRADADKNMQGFRETLT